MQSLPDLTHLSHAQKDALIQVLWQQVQALTTQMQEMQKRILHLEARLALNFVQLGLHPGMGAWRSTAQIPASPLPAMALLNPHPNRCAKAANAP